MKNHSEPKDVDSKSEPGDASSRRPVQAVSRALEILDALAVAGRAVGITDIADRVDMPLPTIHRLLHTLIESDYVFQTPRRQYVIGTRLIALARHAGGALGVTVRPYLAKVVEAVGESAAVAMLDQDLARYISQVPSSHAMRMFTEVGNQVPLHATGTGKAMLASLPPEEARAILARADLRRFTPNTITDLDVLLRELDEIRAQGFAFDREEYEVGVQCVAVAIPGSLRLAMSVSGPPSRLTEEVIMEVALPALRETVEEIAPVLEGVV
ncbi:MAG: IclR family transcriptional regulator [Propionicimonas sp.]